jgi:hypothetical protein
MLSELQLGEFIYEQPASGDIEYIFKHALTHDVAYQSVLNERRRVLHGRIGTALEEIYAESLDDHVAELAHHYARSGNPRKALEYCVLAAQQFTIRGSYAEAVAQFESGIELLQKLPDDDQRAELELDLRNATDDALATIKGYSSPEAEYSSARATQLCRRPGLDWQKSWSALRRAFRIQQTRPNAGKACEIAAELVARAEEHRSAEHMADAATVWAFAKMSVGEFDLADQGFERGWTLLETVAKPTTGLTQLRAGLIPEAQTNAFNRVLSGWNQWYMGYPDRALERLAIATTIAHESRAKTLIERVDYFAANTYALRREPEHLRERAESDLGGSDRFGQHHSPRPKRNLARVGGCRGGRSCRRHRADAPPYLRAQCHRR